MTGRLKAARWSASRQVPPDRNRGKAQSEIQTAVFQESLIASPFSLWRRGISTEQQKDELQSAPVFAGSQIYEKNRLP